METIKSRNAENILEDLIDRACGPRSLSAYGRACGISAAHLSRIRRGICRPTPKMCVKMAEEHYAKELGLSSAEFLRAAGYDGKVVHNTKEYVGVAEQKKETVALGLISKCFLENRLCYQFMPDNGSGIGDSDFSFLVTVDEYKLTWKFIMYLSADAGMEGNVFYYLIGRIFTLKAQPDTRYTVLVENEGLFNRIVEEVNPDILQVDMTIALINTSVMEISKEKILGGNCSGIFPLSSLLNLRKTE